MTLLAGRKTLWVVSREPDGYVLKIQTHTRTFYPHSYAHCSIEAESDQPMSDPHGRLRRRAKRKAFKKTATGLEHHEKPAYQDLLGSHLGVTRKCNAVEPLQGLTLLEELLEPESRENERRDIEMSKPSMGHLQACEHLDGWGCSIRRAAACTLC